MDKVVATDAGEKGGRDYSIPLKLVNGMQAVRHRLDRLMTGMGFLCGAFFLMMAFFITVDVLGRKSGTFSTRATHEISGYILALASTWGFAYALRTDSHVRIDVLLPYMPRQLRAFMDFIAMGTMALLAYIMSSKSWQLALESLGIGATSNTPLLTPLWIPQAIMAVGFSVLSFMAIFMLVSSLAEGVLKVVQSISLSRKELTVAQDSPEDPPAPGER